MLMLLLIVYLQGISIILPSGGQDVPVQVQMDLDSPVFTVEKEFLSVTIDMEMLLAPKWRTFDFNSPRVHTLLRGLAPGYLRFGGGSADNVVYTDVPSNILPGLNLSPGMIQVNSTDIYNLVKLAWKTGFKLIFDLNLQLRYGTQWDPLNAAELLRYVKESGFEDVLSFQLGNEPDSFHNEGPGVVTLNGTQIGKDHKTLKQLLKEYNFRDYIFTGPESAHLGPTSFQLFTDFVKEAGGNITAASIHHYYFSGPNATVADYLNSSHFKGYEHKILHGKSIIKANSPRPDLPLWMTEGAVAQSRGTPGISNRYVSGLLWLETLGVSAKLGVGQCF